MAIEIERKFLVKGEFKAEAIEATHIVQAYLCSDPERTVRVRVRGDKGYITVKGLGDECGIARFEWEKEIPLEEAFSLIRIAEPGVIDKTRHIIPCHDGAHVWEVDEFHGNLEGLVLAEIELNSPEDGFDRPDWLGEEVTGDSRYYNSSLSKGQKPTDTAPGEL